MIMTITNSAHSRCAVMTSFISQFMASQRFKVYAHAVSAEEQCDGRVDPRLAFLSLSTRTSLTEAEGRLPHAPAQATQ